MKKKKYNKNRDFWSTQKTDCEKSLGTLKVGNEILNSDV